MVVLDTHAWIWWTDDPGRLSPEALAAVDEAETVGVCAISCWEVAMLVVSGRLSLDRDVSEWVRLALAQAGVLALEIGPKVALAAAALGEAGFVPDPADRLIYATARNVGAPLVTRDRGIREFDPRGTLW